MKRSNEERTTQMEDEMKKLKDLLENHLGPAKTSYSQAEGALRKEKKHLEDFQFQYAERLDKMQASLGKAERDLSVLKSQWTSNKKILEDMANQLSPTQDLAREAIEQLRQVDEKQQTVWAVVRMLQDDLHDFTHRTPGEESNDVEAPGLLSLASELSGPRLEDQWPPSPNYVSSRVKDDERWDCPRSQSSLPSSQGDSAWSDSELSSALLLDCQEHGEAAVLQTHTNVSDTPQAQARSTEPPSVATAATIGQNFVSPAATSGLVISDLIVKFHSICNWWSAQALCKILEGVPLLPDCTSPLLLALLSAMLVTDHRPNCLSRASVVGMGVIPLNNVFIENDEEQSGRLLTEKIRKKHLEADKWRKEQEELRESTVSHTILLAAASQPLSRQGSISLPVRRRDTQDNSSFQENVTDAPTGGSTRASSASTPSTHNEGERTAQSSTPPSGAIAARERSLANLTSIVQRLRNRFPSGMGLTFSNEPSMDGPPPEPNEATFVEAYQWFLEQRRYIEEDLPPLSHYEMDRRRIGLLRTIEDPSKLAYAKSLQPFVLAALIMSIVLHSLAAVSRVHVDYVLATLQAVLYGTVLWCNAQSGDSSDLTPSQASWLKTVPGDTRTVLTSLGLEPDIIRYACCPQCFATYLPDPDKPDDPYPRSCTFQETNKPICGAELVYEQEHAPTHKGGKVKTTLEPLQVYPYRTVESYLTDLLSRPGYVKMMKTAWTRSSNPKWRDLFDAPGLRNFLGPDGRTPFSEQSDGCVHIVFSLFIDWFNPFGNKKAGKSHSVGAIYLVCNNLPPHLRYKPENICLVGIIPGPREPQLHQLNHLLRPLIDELLVLWHCGLLFAGASPLDPPLLIKAAMIPLVCDLPALRKTAGFAGHMSSHFCSFCELTKDRINDLNRLKWPRHSWDDHRRYARAWLDAPTEAARDVEFKKHGIRWSELLRLEYWDPTRFAVVDAMHNLFLGELRHHCRDVWGLDVKDKTGDSKGADPHTPEQQRVQLQRVITGLHKHSKNALDKVRKGYVVAVAEFNGVAPEAGEFTKAAYVAALISWAKDFTGSIKLPPVLEESTADFHLVEGPHDISKFRVLDQHTLDQIRKDIAATSFPSWMERPPKNFGSPSHGKLKADQWRTVCTVSLVISLCRLWGSSTASRRQRLLLDNFLDLARAVDLAARHAMDQPRVEKYDGYMLSYLTSLRSLFGHQLVPNHHLSLHLRECLSLFGPVHAWWAFPFERFNGLLGRLNTNSKSAQMAVTFMRYFYIGVNLRWLMNTTKWPDMSHYQHMVAAYKDAVMNAVSIRGVNVADIVAFESHETDTDAYMAIYDEQKEVNLSADVHRALATLLRPSGDKQALSAKCHHIRSVDRDGMTFATRKAGKRNSFVLFSSDHSDTWASSFPRAGQIADIFIHARREAERIVFEPFFVIDEYMQLGRAHATQDPYRSYADLETCLHYNKFHPTQRVVRLSNIQCHFASLVCTVEGINEECIVD
ncbi:hypothetical protein GSI_10049 [Ganoderma sinense ZZ0214-1]|uniref:DUF4218 domain-containing protein n=1 Tax=Ganoderma sinense ZZ0214-1 TaxID=1077348 RepID=A0A2G8RZG7_9APHY|nr:hypothetical protein GSI_10049 [Ganoderma sinense ZZ0214-1]